MVKKGQKLKIKREVLYSKRALEDIKKQGYTWWIIHSDEHPSGKKHIIYLYVRKDKKMKKIKDIN